MTILDRNMFIHLCLKLKQDCENRSDQAQWIIALAVATVPKYIFVRGYNNLVAQSKLIQLELLKVEDKTNIWETAKEIANGRLTKEELIEFCKVLLCLEYFLQNE